LYGFVGIVAGTNEGIIKVFSSIFNGIAFDNLNVH